MKKIVLSVLFLLLLAGSSWAYESSVHRFSIDFPDGWVIEKDISPGSEMVQATHESGAFLVVGSNNQFSNYGLLGNGVSLNEFAKDLSSKVLYPMASQICDRITPVSTPEGRIDSGKKIVRFVTYCDDAILTFFVVFNRSKGYMMMSYGDFDDKDTFSKLTASMHSFELN